MKITVDGKKFIVLVSSESYIKTPDANGFFQFRIHKSGWLNSTGIFMCSFYLEKNRIYKTLEAFLYSDEVKNMIIENIQEKLKIEENHNTIRRFNNE